MKSFAPAALAVCGLLALSAAPASACPVAVASVAAPCQVRAAVAVRYAPPAVTVEAVPSVAAVQVAPAVVAVQAVPVIAFAPAFVPYFTPAAVVVQVERVRRARVVERRGIVRKVIRRRR